MGNHPQKNDGTGRADGAARAVRVGTVRPRGVPAPVNDNRAPLHVRLRMAAGLLGLCALIAGIVLLAL